MGLGGGACSYHARLAGAKQPPHKACSYRARRQHRLIVPRTGRSSPWPWRCSALLVASARLQVEEVVTRAEEVAVGEEPTRVERVVGQNLPSCHRS
nr:unnamed protein product [Digitaria exilis]